MKIGYIKLHRKIQNNFLWLEERKFSRAEAWIDLLMEANHYGQTVLISGHSYYCKRGQTCKSILTWSNRWRWSRQKVKDFLILLQKEAQIEFETDTRTTMVTILNYNIYQDPQDKIIKDEIKILNETLQQKSNRKATEKQQKDINNNDKNEKKDKNKSVGLSIEDFTNLNNERFKTSWQEWQVFRKEIKHTLTPSTIKKQLKFLSKQPDPIAIINQSIEKGWQGLFELNGTVSVNENTIKLND